MRFQQSKIHDWGLVALEPIEAEDFVIEYVGELIRSSVSMTYLIMRSINYFVRVVVLYTILASLMNLVVLSKDRLVCAVSFNLVVIVVQYVNLTDI